MYSIDEKTLVDTITYLAKRPYTEVFGLVERLQKCERQPEVEPKKDKK